MEDDAYFNETGDGHIGNGNVNNISSNYDKIQFQTAVSCQTESNPKPSLHVASETNDCGTPIVKPQILNIFQILTENVCRYCLPNYIVGSHLRQDLVSYLVSQLVNCLYRSQFNMQQLTITYIQFSALNCKPSTMGVFETTMSLRHFTIKLNTRTVCIAILRKITNKVPHTTQWLLKIRSFDQGSCITISFNFGCSVCSLKSETLTQ